MYLQILQEGRIVHERQGVENVEFGIVCNGERVADERLQPALQCSRRVGIWVQPDARCVVEEVRRVQNIVLGVVDDRRRQGVEREEVGYLVRLGVLCRVSSLACRIERKMKADVPRQHKSTQPAFPSSSSPHSPRPRPSH